ncbi:MAG: DUF5680 domain-containing protein [Candidatus Paceibacterota bacterium]|jgi:hypothetical protein
MIDLTILKKFLVEAKKYAYASGDKSRKIKELDGSKTLIYERGDWKYHDNYFGGEPYGGREVVFYKGKPVWIMVYYGTVIASVSQKRLKEIYEFLQQCLSLVPENKPFRGRETSCMGDFYYRNKNEGTVSVEKFSGIETITYLNSQIVYTANYFGGLVDQRDDGIE